MILSHARSIWLRESFFYLPESFIAQPAWRHWSSAPWLAKWTSSLLRLAGHASEWKSQTIAQDCPDNRICESLQNPGHTQSQFSARLASKLLPAFHLILMSIRIELQCRCQTWKAVGRKWMALFALLSRDYATLRLPMSTFAKSPHNKYL